MSDDDNSLSLPKSDFEMIKQGKLHLTQAAKRCEISYHQTKRIYQSHQQKRDAGLTQ